MPSSTPAAVRKQIAAGTPDPLYLILGDDEAEMSHLAADLSGIVEDELRAFNVERIYATDKSSTAASIVEAARQLPMMSARRVVVVLRAEKLLKPRRKAKAGEASEPEDTGPVAPDRRCARGVRQESRAADRPGSRRVRRRSDAPPVQGPAEAGHHRRVLGTEGQQRRAGSISGRSRGRPSSSCGRR